MCFPSAIRTRIAIVTHRGINGAEQVHSHSPRTESCELVHVPCDSHTYVVVVFQLLCCFMQLSEAVLVWSFLNRSRSSALRRRGSCYDSMNRTQMSPSTTLSFVILMTQWVEERDYVWMTNLLLLACDSTTSRTSVGRPTGSAWAPGGPCVQVYREACSAHAYSEGSFQLVIQRIPTATVYICYTYIFHPFVQLSLHLIVGPS